MALALSEYLSQRDPAHRGDVRGTAELLEPVHGGLDQVVGIARAEALRQDVLHARDLEHRTHATARDHARTGRRRLEQHVAGAEAPGDDVRDRAVLGDRDVEHVLLRGFARLADGVGDFVRLAQADADAAVLVAHCHDRVEREPAAALHHLGDPVDMNHPLAGKRVRVEFEVLGVRSAGKEDLQAAVIARQNRSSQPEDTLLPVNRLLGGRHRR